MGKRSRRKQYYSCHEKKKRPMVLKSPEKFSKMKIEKKPRNLRIKEVTGDMMRV